MTRGKKALFGEPNRSKSRVSEGKAALYEAANYRSASQPTVGKVGYECSQCSGAGVVGYGDAVRRILRFTLWFPGKQHSRWMECPSCGQRTWLQLRWLPR